MDPLRSIFLLNMGIFHCYVSLPKGTVREPSETPLILQKLNKHPSAVCLRHPMVPPAPASFGTEVMFLGKHHGVFRWWLGRGIPKKKGKKWGFPRFPMFFFWKKGSSNVGLFLLETMVIDGLDFDGFDGCDWLDSFDWLIDWLIYCFFWESMLFEFDHCQMYWQCHAIVPSIFTSSMIDKGSLVGAQVS